MAPYLPKGSTDTFTSRYIHANGVRLHAVVGGKGPPLLLVHGWPQTWYQWRLVMPALARGLPSHSDRPARDRASDKPQNGYDFGTQANDLIALMDALGHKRFAMIGFDTGMGIGYALAADHPDRVERLVVGEAIITSIYSLPPLIVPGPLNKRLWHIAFNRLDGDVNERLVRGREDIYFGAEYAQSALLATRLLKSSDTLAPALNEGLGVGFVRPACWRFGRRRWRRRAERGRRLPQLGLC